MADRKTLLAVEQAAPDGLPAGYPAAPPVLEEAASRADRRSDRAAAPARGPAPVHRSGPLRQGAVAAALAAFARRVEPLTGFEAIALAMHQGLASLLDIRHFAAFESDTASVLACRYTSSPLDEVPDGLSDAAIRCAAEEDDTVASLGEPHALCCPLRDASGIRGVVCAVVAAGVAEDDLDILRSVVEVAALALARQREGRTRRLLAEMVERADDAVSLYDAAGSVLFTNPAYHKLFDHQPDAETLRGTSREQLDRLDLAAGIIDDPLALSDPDRYCRQRSLAFAALQAESRQTEQIKGRGYIDTRARLKTGETLSRRIDVTEARAVEMRLRASQQRLEEIAYVDLTTGLFNRTRFRERIDGEPGANRAPMAVVLINLDRFKAVNDGLGDAAGDDLLRMVAERLRRCVRSGDLPARLGGDEFAVCCALRSGANGAAKLVDRLFDVFREPFVVAGRKIGIGVSIGVAGFPDHGTTADALLHHARVALRAAKAAGGQQCRYFDAAMAAALADRRMLALDLREAVALGQLELHYQPLVAIATGAVEGFEALARWRHPVRGMVSPADFIPIAEESGLIATIGSWVLRQALADARHLPPGLTMAVNLSPRQIAHSDIVETAVGSAREYGFDLSRLELEITESHALQDDRIGVETLRQLRGLGVGISLDDFGTGYSSLSYLLSFPFTKIKIDKSFVGAMVHRADASAIVTAVISLAERLKMTVTAEGVETQDQLARLKGLGCHQAQGYLIARPLPLDALLAWLEARTEAVVARSPAATAAGDPENGPTTDRPAASAGYSAAMPTRTGSGR